MTRIPTLVVSILFMSHLAFAQARHSPLEITLKHNDMAEKRTKTQLLRLLAAHDVSRWIFTRKIAIESGYNVIPHSHPVLTLSVRHLKDDELLLSTFVHEQLHWYLLEKRKETDAVYQELKQMFPRAPVGFPEGGSSEEWTYKHIPICYFEFQALREIYGELRAKQIMEFWATDHYTWIYKTVLERESAIRTVMYKHKLEPFGRSRTSA